MDAYVSQFQTKIDKKGRLCIPALYRAILAKDGFAGLYCIPTPDQSAIDAGGHALLAQFEEKLSQLSSTSKEYDLLATAFYGESAVLTIDAEGRVQLGERFITLAGLREAVLFVGKGKKFQIWEPQRYQHYRAKALEAARAVLWGQEQLS